jgi:hypothetical protein
MGFAENTVKFRGKEVQAQERNKRDILAGVSNQFQCLFSGYK